MGSGCWLNCYRKIGVSQKGAASGAGLIMVQDGKILETEGKITEKMLEDYRVHLVGEEKSKSTVEKYIRSIRKLMGYAEQGIDKDVVIAYKKNLMESRKYKVSSINSMLIDINQFLEYRGWYDCRVKTYKVQKILFCPDNKYLSKEEYKCLLKEAKKKGKIRLYFLLETLAATGMRVSELSFLTVEAVREGSVMIYSKGKVRVILLPSELQRQLLWYAKQKGIEEGIVFRTRYGNVVNRSNVWKNMKDLCKGAKVNPEKVFPHNLRHLFAQCFYKEKKDLAELASIMGHSSVETTKVYLTITGKEHRKELEKMDMVQPLDDLLFEEGMQKSLGIRNRNKKGSTRNKICFVNDGCTGNRIYTKENPTASLLAKPAAGKK